MPVIDVDRILQSIERSRAQAGASTTSLNVIAFVEHDDELLARLRERIAVISQRHATRCIVLIDADEAGERIEGERMELPAGPGSAAELRSAVRALLVPGVRTVLLWAGEHLRDERFEQLAGLCDVAVLFSSARDPGLEPLRELLALRVSPVMPRIRDLSFLRLYPWQDMVAQLFDDPEVAAELALIERVEVAAGSEPEAYYLIGWLASRLGWEPCGAHEFCNAQGATVGTTFTQAGSARRIQRVDLRSAHARFCAEIDERSDDLIQLHKQSARTRERRCLPIHDVDMVSLIERAIFDSSGGELFAQTLAMVGRLVELRA